MKFPNSFKYFWWAFILLLCSGLLYLRLDVIIGGTPQAFDTMLLAIMAALLLLPLFAELSLLGITFKQQIEETKKELKHDVKEQLSTLRAEFQNMVSVSNRLNSQVFVNAPPPDSQLPTLEEQIRPILNELRRELRLTTQPQPLQDLVPSQNTLLAFSSRYQIEREITRIWNNRFMQGETARQRNIPFARMVEELVRAEVISSDLGRSLREVYSIGSPAVHGEEPSSQKISFLNEVVPSLIAALRGIP